MDTAHQLLQEIQSIGVRVTAHGDKLRLEPGSKVTDELADRMRVNKGKLLAVLRSAPDAPATNTTGQDVDGNAEAAAPSTQPPIDGFDGWTELHRPDGRLSLVRPDGGLSWTHPEHADNDTKVIDPPEACLKCGSLYLWQSAAGDLLGLTAGRWRCTRCDPPAG